MWMWRKLGLIYSAGGEGWRSSHASLPTPIRLDGSLYRILYAARDERNRSSVGYFDIDLDDPTRILAESSEPVLSPGPLGTFDDHGVYPASAVRDGERIMLFTIGWNPGVESPLFYATIGLAVSEDGGRTFRRTAPAPILARSPVDPCLVTSPMVLKEGGRWRMWYVSGNRWERTEQGLQSYYNVKYAESKDGHVWERDGRVCLDHADESETNISRACVIRDGGVYRAWYGFASSGNYKIGYAESADGLEWRRRDSDAGIGVSSSGWDSEAIAYPYVIPHAGKYFMFYNGNRFGKDGVGLAVGELERPA